MPKSNSSSPSGTTPASGSSSAPGPSGATSGSPGSGSSAAPAGGASAPCPCAQASITSVTAATMPTNRVRTRLGVGESTDVTYSLGSATWTMSPANAGSLSGTSGPTVTYTAPDRADNSPVTITATGSGCTKTIVFTIVEPSSVRMERRPGTQKNHTLHQASTGFIADIYILPADVSFQNCSYLESDVDAVGRGCFQRYMETHH